VRPEDVVKGNTAAAFDAFYGFDEFIAVNYLCPERLALYALVADHCAARPAATAVDVGCGTGHALLALQRRLPAVALTGLDYAAVGVARARALLPAATFVVGDLYDAALSAGAYDLVLCLETLEHLTDPAAAVVELRRLCAPGGRVVLTVPNGALDHWDGHRWFWTPAELTAFLRPHGLAYLALLQADTALLAELTKE
jgi:2-polyprenyl-3-methyl-5-hydroxy-6-metoxy-1,4-benzoquinol methylase